MRIPGRAGSTFGEANEGVPLEDLEERIPHMVWCCAKETDLTPASFVDEFPYFDSHSLLFCQKDTKGTLKFRLLEKRVLFGFFHEIMCFALNYFADLGDSQDDTLKHICKTLLCKGNA